jgi:energy-coupling factor transporter ATP-binding protein EcfA2
MPKLPPPARPAAWRRRDLCHHPRRSACESGSGKSTIARLLARIYAPTSGEIYFEGERLSRKDMLRYRGLVPMVFQDPFASINPVFRVSHGILRGIKLHRPELSAADRRAEAERVFETVGLNPAAEVLQRYPHELSGGQRQRVGFAQALALRPRLILADEPVSMLDVSIRIGLLNLMIELRDKAGVSILYITHDIASARWPRRSGGARRRAADRAGPAADREHRGRSDRPCPGGDHAHRGRPGGGVSSPARTRPHRGTVGRRAAPARGLPQHGGRLAGAPPLARQPAPAAPSPAPAQLPRPP